MHIVRLYPLMPGTTATDVRRELAAHYVDIGKIVIRSARTIQPHITGCKQAMLYFADADDARLFAGIFQNTTHHPILLHRYSFVPEIKFGPWAFIGALHARAVVVPRRPLRQIN